MPKLLEKKKLKRAYHLSAHYGWSDEEIAADIDATIPIIKRWRKISIADPANYQYGTCHSGLCSSDEARPGTQ